MNSDPRIRRCIRGRNGDAILNPELRAICAFYQKRRCLHMPAEDESACLGIYVESPIALFTITILHDVRGNLLTRATLASLTPPEARPVMARFAEMMNERIPGGRFDFNSATGELALVCHVERSNPDTPLPPSVIEEHMAYCCRMFYLLSGLIEAINGGHFDEKEMVQCTKVTWLALRPLVPYLANDKIVQEGLVQLLCMKLSENPLLKIRAGRDPQKPPDGTSIAGSDD